MKPTFRPEDVRGPTPLDRTGALGEAYRKQMSDMEDRARGWLQRNADAHPSVVYRQPAGFPQDVIGEWSLAVRMGFAHPNTSAAALVAHMIEGLPPNWEPTLHMVKTILDKVLGSRGA